MKQRLLLCLLMLMVSVGLVKAGVTIKIDQGDPKESVIITFTSSSNKFVPQNGTNPSYPVITEYTDAKYLSVSAGKAVYTIPYNTKGETINLSMAYPTATDAVWGDVTITLNGKITEFVTDNDDNSLTDHITSLKFENNGVLKNYNWGIIKFLLLKRIIQN